MESSSHFDSVARNWDTDEVIKRNEHFSIAIKKHTAQNHFKRVLDFGCGTGLLSSFLLNDVNELVGIETSEGMITQFNERFKNYPSVKSIVINLENENTPSDLGRFDLIMTAMAFHHLKKPQRILSILKKHLNPGGKVFIIDLDEEDGTFHPDNKSMGVHHFGFSKDTLQSWANELGFSLFEHEIVLEINKNNRTYGIGMGVFS